MSADELIEFEKRIDMSMATKDAKRYLYKGIKERRIELDNKISPNIEHSEIKPGDIN